MLSKPLKLKLRAHLDEVDEGYFEHALHAGEYALTFAVLTVTIKKLIIITTIASSTSEKARFNIILTCKIIHMLHQHEKICIFWENLHPYNLYFL